MSEKIMFLFSKEDVLRISEKMIKGRKIIFVDMHGMKAKVAKKFLNNLISLNTEGYDMCIIHGYNHGTAIKEIVYNELSNDRIKEKKVYENNLGRTYLKIAKVA